MLYGRYSLVHKSNINYNIRVERIVSHFVKLHVKEYEKGLACILQIGIFESSDQVKFLVLLIRVYFAEHFLKSYVLIKIFSTQC